MINELDELLLGSLYLKQRKYWISKLTNITKTHLSDSADIQQTNAFEVVDFKLPEELSTRIVNFSKNSDLLIYVILISGLKGLLYRYLNNENISIISPVYEPLVNEKTLNANILINSDINGKDSFKDFLKKVKNTIVEAYENQDYPFERIMEQLDLKNDVSDITCQLISIHKENKSDIFNTNLVLKYSNFNEDIFIKVSYNSVLYSLNIIDRTINHLNAFLNNAIKDIENPIENIEFISEDEKRQLMYEFNNTDEDYPENKTIIDLFEDQVKMNPQNDALLFGDKKIRYLEFSEEVNQLVGFLLAKGIRNGDIIGLMSERSMEMMIGIYAILKVGGVYLPIDPNYPEERIKYIIENSKTKTILCQENYKSTFNLNIEFLSLESNEFKSYSKEPVKSFCAPNDLAYVIYTSGSTGNPKGVMIEHHSLVNRINWMGKAYPVNHQDVFIQKTTISFDVSVWELVWWSVAGASLLLLKPLEEKNPKRIIEDIGKYNVSVMHFVPSMLHVFLDELRDGFEYSRLRTLKFVFSSGEALEKNDVIRFNNTLFKENNTKLINLYGPTEATIDVSYFNCSPLGTFNIIPIGKPIDNIKLSIVDKNKKIVPIGVNGELCISGVGVARGYLNNEELTKEKFVTCIFDNGRRMYRTGDLASWLPDGNIQFLGRLDNQIKIRGHRIELGEIENQLNTYSKVERSVVIDKGEGIDKILVAYYMSKESIDKDELRGYLSKKLADYMIPVHFIHIDQFPLTKNGKIDRKALPKPEFSRNIKRLPPRNDVELQIAKIWAELLKIEIDEIGIHDNFFDLGGNSIKILKLTYSINETFGCDLTVAEIFDRNRIVDLAEYILSGRKNNFVEIEKEIDESIQDRNEFLNMESLLN